MLIYARVDPRTGVTRYIGKTVRTAHRRLRRHLARCYLDEAHTHKNRWIKQLIALGLEPTINVLQTCASAAELSTAECRHIAEHLARDVPLTNATPGGDGGGYRHTDASKARLRLAHLGRQRSPEHAANLAAANRARTGLKASPETRAKLSALRHGMAGPLPRYGQDNNKTKLTDAQVIEIRASRGLVSQRLLAIKYGVSKTAVRYIQTGRNRKAVREFPEARA